jgi:hypothetical protein
MLEITSLDAWDGSYMAHPVIRAIGPTRHGNSCEQKLRIEDRQDSSVSVVSQLQGGRYARRRNFLFYSPARFITELDHSARRC